HCGPRAVGVNRPRYRGDPADHPPGSLVGWAGGPGIGACAFIIVANITNEVRWRVVHPYARRSLNGGRLAISSRGWLQQGGRQRMPGDAACMALWAGADLECDHACPEAVAWKTPQGEPRCATLRI